MKPSLIASQSFSIDVEPASVIVPDADASVVSLLSDVAPLSADDPHPANKPAIIIAAMPIAVVFINFLFILNLL